MADGNRQIVSRTSQPLQALLIGLAATLLVAAGHLAGIDKPLELRSLDLRFRHLAAAPQSRSILHIDIDDGSLQQAGRWPWPRRQFAGMIDVLLQCGARTVALDIEMPEPQELRYESAAEEIYSTNYRIIDTLPPLRVFDDMELVQALRQNAQQADQKSPTTTPVEAAAIFLPMHLDLERGDAKTPLLAAVQRILEAEPTLAADEVASRLQADRTWHDAGIPEKELRQNYLRARATLAMRKFGQRADPADCFAQSLHHGPLIPPMLLLASAISHSGYVTVLPDEDGTVRRIPLLAASQGWIYRQMAFSIAMQELSRQHGSFIMTTRPGAIDVRFADGTCRLMPVDRNGMLLINWMKPQTGKGPEHISAAGVLNVWKIKHSIQEVHRTKRACQADLANKLQHPPLLRLFAAADELERKKVGQQILRHQHDLLCPGRPLPEMENLSEQEQACEKAIENAIAELADPFMQETEQDRKAWQEYQRNIAALPDYAKTQQEILAVALADLRARVHGKICLIGSSATGAADFVPTPVGPRMPGVQVHANIINTLLTGAFVHTAPAWLNLLATLLAGALVAMVAAHRPIITQAGPAVVVLAGGYVAFASYALFAAWNYWLVIVAPLAAMLLSFVAVTAFRQFTEERAKQHIRGMFARALSPALVDRIIEDPSLLKLGGQRRELTCFFSDLQGFTPLAERLGEQKTVSLLNRYFDRITEVVQDRCGGYLNKFLGDGIFVFFGAPVVQEDHAARALAASVQCQQQIALLSAQLSEETGQDIALRVRIGIATGEVMVGNCGSSQRMDYTAIGDTVNLASRLDGANKFFGTNILLSSSTLLKAGKGDWLARPLGLVKVVGKQEAVEIWNLLGFRSQSPQELVEGCTNFAAGVEAFRQAKFAAAIELFENSNKALRGDRASQIYLELCRKNIASQPEGDWQILRLSEK